MKRLTEEDLKMQFNIEDQFDMYLKLMGLDRRKMPPAQLTTAKEAFYGAFGQCLMVLQEVDFDEADTHKVFNHLTAQISKFFNEACHRHVVRTLPKN